MEDATQDNPVVKQCIEHILANIDDDGLNVNTLGAALGMGRNRLQKEIKTATGMTPVEFIRSIRLHEAYKMMQDKQYNISEIAYKTGFNNLSYFSRSFKAQYGYAPSEISTAAG
jgi:AraC-like DNA-binding protein